MEQTLNKVTKILFLVSIIILGIFLVFDVYPQLQRMIFLQQKTQTMRKVVEVFPEAERVKRQQGLEEELAKITQGYKDIKAAAQVVNTRVIKDKNIPIVTLKIEELAETAQIELVLIKPLKIQAKDQYEILPIEIECLGEYGDLVSLLSQIESEKLLMTVESISIKKISPASSRLEARLLLHVLFGYAKDKVS